MHFHSIKVSTLDHALASIFLALSKSTSRDADVIANFYWERVEQILSSRIGLLKEPAELMKETNDQLFDLMQPTTESRLAQHSWHQSRLLHKASSRFKITAEVKSSTEGCSNDFGISKEASLVISMANSFKLLVRDRVERGNIVEHNPLLNSIGVDSERIFYISKSFTQCSTSNSD